MNNRLANFKPDYLIAIIVIMLALFGVVMVYSSTYHNSLYAGDDGRDFFVKQAFGVMLGLAAMFILSYVNYNMYSNRKFLIVVSAVTIIMLIAVLFTPEINGARRWLKITNSLKFQPAEIARFVILVLTSSVLANNIELSRSRNIMVFVVGVKEYFIVLVLMCLLIILEFSLSMTLLAVGTALCLFLIAGVNFRPIVFFGTIIGIGGFLAIRFSPVRYRRVQEFFASFNDVSKAGYQIKQSLYALGAGGIRGAGLGESKQKLLYLPYGNSDFILSIIGEELGFIGIFLLLVAYVVLIVRGFVTAINCKNMFGSLLAAGITATIALQLVMNIAVVTGSMPATGVPLPFISAGNTSLIIFMSSIGILLNISRQTIARMHG